MRTAGAIIIGKTNMGEFAAGYLGSAFGVAHNAYNPSRSPSGSSSGSGIGVAANFAVLAVAETRLCLRAAFRAGRRPSTRAQSRFKVVSLFVYRQGHGARTGMLTGLLHCRREAASRWPLYLFRRARRPRVPFCRRSLLTRRGAGVACCLRYRRFSLRSRRRDIAPRERLLGLVYDPQNAVYEWLP